MLKYNYKGAAALWQEYFDLCVCDMSFGGVEKQQERRYFMRAITHNEDIKIYLNYIDENIADARPVEGVKSRCFDFNYERELEALKRKLVLFSHSIERYAE